MAYYLTEKYMITLTVATIVTTIAVSPYVNATDTTEYFRRPFRCSRPSDHVKGASVIPSCPHNMVYMTCTLNCTRSCLHPNGQTGCHNNCTEPGGCVCPKGFLWKESNCVIPEECRCFVSSEFGVLAENEIYINDICTKRCMCDSTGQFICDDGYRCDDNAACDVREGKWQCYCDDGLVGDGVNTCTRPIDCQQILLAGHTQDGVYTIHPLNWTGLPFEVYCNMTIDGGGWTVFQRRVNGSINFNRGWEDYKHGFGILDHEFWLGNEKLYYLTNQQDSELRIDMVNVYGSSYYAKYTLFRVSNETMNYKLIAINGYKGTTSYNAMSYHSNMYFSTYDHDRDTLSGNCAERWNGGWWYASCIECNLNGDYYYSGGTRMTWVGLREHYYLKYAEMQIRPL